MKFIFVSFQLQYFPGEMAARLFGEDEFGPNNLMGVRYLTKQQYQAYYEEKYKNLNNEQSAFVDKIMKAVDDREAKKRNVNRYHYLTGDGGTGKTYVYNVILLIIKLLYF